MKKGQPHCTHKKNSLELNIRMSKYGENWTSILKEKVSEFIIQSKHKDRIYEKKATE